MNFKNLFSVLLICVILFSFSTISKDATTKKVPTKQKRSCNQHDIRIFYHNNVTYEKITSIRNHFIKEYDIYVLYNTVGFQTISSNSTTFYRSETWSICPTGGPRPGNGGIDGEIDEEPGMGLINNFM